MLLLHDMKQWIMRKGTVYTVIGLFIALVIMAAIIVFFTGGSPRKAVIMIPPGATEASVRDTLAKYYGDAYAGRVMQGASFIGGKLHEKPGLYDIEEGTSLWRVIWRLNGRRQTPVKFTINNQRTRQDIVNAVAQKFYFTPEALDSVLNDADEMAEYGLTPENATALFLNNTHEALWSNDPKRVVHRIGKAYNQFWTDERKAKAAKLNLKPEEVIIIASIAEEESTHADERGRIGRLYINRLQKGMRLQADPTVRFAMNDFTIRRVGRDMLMVESPYNTYRHEGLPPAPIRTVEPATVDAILNSAPSEDLYMCAKPDFSGYHVFTDSYSAHQQNALAYRKALNAKGIK